MDMFSNVNDESPMDFDNLGDVKLGFSLLDDNSSDTEGFHDTADHHSGDHKSDDESIPISPEDASKIPRKEIPADADGIIESLREVCAAHGVSCSEQMINQVKYLSTKETILEDHMIWYVRGLNMANNTMIIPSIKEAISDIKMETKHMANVTNKMMRCGTDIATESKAFNNQMNIAVHAIKDAFVQTVEAVADTYKSRVGTPDVEIVTVNVPDPPTGTVQTRGKEKVTDESPKAKERAIEETVADESSIVLEKKAMLKKVGFSLKMIKELEDDDVNAILDNNFLNDLKSMVMGAKKKAEIKKKITDNLHSYLEDEK
ncbi:TPA_asm: P [Mentha alphacytorhabdovirus 1]|nr:TPA_asm: P [Mentha alphacytorhabdovirus 1]